MTRKAASAMEHLNLAAKLADLKEDHYRILLTLSAMTELLIDKGLLTREELELKSRRTRHRARRAYRRFTSSHGVGRS